jgi:hypothetical protein
MTYQFFSDPGHGWLKVLRLELRELCIAHRVSRYSYQRGVYAYLEEDCDVALFADAKHARGEHVDARTTCSNRDSRIRGYERYTVTPEDVPAAACSRCYGWTAHGGMSQHSRGPQGCTCNA